MTPGSVQSKDIKEQQSPEMELESATSNFKLITTTTGMRVSQACDRCRIKKIKCDGLRPCHNCSKINFECKTSDKLTRRAFPKGYTENLEKKLAELEEENRKLKMKYGDEGTREAHYGDTSEQPEIGAVNMTTVDEKGRWEGRIRDTNENPSLRQHTVPINNPIDQIFNLNEKGIIIGNDNLNFESQFNHLLVELNLPFLKITNSHNFLLNNPNANLYNRSNKLYRRTNNKDLDVIFNPLTAYFSNQEGSIEKPSFLSNENLPIDVYELFIKLVNNIKNMVHSRTELDNQIKKFFLNHNVFVPIFDYKEFMTSYEAFHTMYPFLFTYGDATINGFNLLNNDYEVVNDYFMIVVQIYAMMMINDPTVNLNLLLHHSDPRYAYTCLQKNGDDFSEPLVKSLYDFLPYFNVFHVSIPQLQTYLLFFHYSLITNNKEKSLILSSLVNAFIGILGVNMNSKNLFFNDLLLDINQKRTRVKCFWVFKVLLKCFNLKFGFKPSINTTVINPVTIERYFELTPEKLSLLLDCKENETDILFTELLKTSVEFLNLLNIIIPSSFSPNYYQYLKNSNQQNQATPPKKHAKHLDWILNDDGGDGNDGNLNYNFNQFVIIDRNLTNWRNSLNQIHIDLDVLTAQLNLPSLGQTLSDSLYQKLEPKRIKYSSGITDQGEYTFFNTGLPDAFTATQLIKIQLNFHYLLIRSMNYLNFVVDRELKNSYYYEISEISLELLCYFILIFGHIGESTEVFRDESHVKRTRNGTNAIVMDSLGLDIDEEGFVINDFSVKRRKTDPKKAGNTYHKRIRRIGPSLFNNMINGLSMTVINIKKSILLLLLYLLICQLKNADSRTTFTYDKLVVINKSADLFCKIFTNYITEERSTSTAKRKQDDLFKKLMNDEMVEQLLHEAEYEDDSEYDEVADMRNHAKDIDWDDDRMDEDIKYLKIVKIIKYRINLIYSNITSSKGSHSIVDGQEAFLQDESKIQKDHSKADHKFNSEIDSALSLNHDDLHVQPFSKLDHFLDDSVQSKLGSQPQFAINPLHAERQMSANELIRKEKLSINDLLNMKNAYTNGNSLSNNFLFNSAPWNYAKQRNSMDDGRPFRNNENETSNSAE